MIAHDILFQREIAMPKGKQNGNAEILAYALRHLEQERDNGTNDQNSFEPFSQDDEQRLEEGFPVA